MRKGQDDGSWRKEFSKLGASVTIGYCGVKEYVRLSRKANIKLSSRTNALQAGAGKTVLTYAFYETLLISLTKSDGNTAELSPSITYRIHYSPVAMRSRP